MYVSWNTGTDLLIVEPVVLVDDNVIHNIVPNIEIQMLVEKNVCIGIHFTFKNIPLVSGS
jgi:hypothetical protein